MLSLVKVRVVLAGLSWTSRPTTASAGVVVVPATQLNGLDTYGPSSGVETLEPVWVQPVEVPVRAWVVDDAGPDAASVSALVTVKEPAADPR